MLACLMTRAMRQEPLKTRDEVIPVYSFPGSAGNGASQRMRLLCRVEIRTAWNRARLFVDTDVKAARYIVREALKQRGNGWLNPDEIACRPC